MAIHGHMMEVNLKGCILFNPCHILSIPFKAQPCECLQRNPTRNNTIGKGIFHYCFEVTFDSYE